MKTLTFRNEIQKALFEVELQGQISDGMWENARPFDHWKVWGNCEVTVGEDVGRDFYAMKDNYAFDSKNLLDCIGDRMVAICNMAENGYDAKTIRKFYDYYGVPRNITMNIKPDMTPDELLEAYNNNYYIQKDIDMSDAFQGSYENLQKARQGSYDIKKLRKELKDMKGIIKMRKR